MKMIDIGFGSFLASDKILLILSPESAPVKRVIAEARAAGRLVDATYGRKTATVLVTESDHVVLSAVEPEQLKQRFAEEG